MSEVRVKSWPLAVAGSLMLHATVATGVYMLPASSGSVAAPGQGAMDALAGETAPIYLIADDLPADVAERLAAERAAPAKAESLTPAPAPKTEPTLAADQPKPFEPIPVPLGVVDGPKIDTKTWLKSVAEGENAGILSPVNQAQMDLKAVPAPQGDPGEGGQDGKGGATKVEAATTPALPIAPTLPVLAPAPAVAPARAEAPVERSVDAAKPKTDAPEGPSQTKVEVGNSGGEPPAKAQPATEPRAEVARPAVEPKPAVEGVAGGAVGTPAAPVQPALEAAGAPGSPGVPAANKKVAADRDADAASVKRAAVFRNGKVEAGEGLDIRTVRPEFSLATRALRQPRSPTLEIVFGKDGRAKNVRVLKSSGFPAEVDDPVVTALYNWRAKGRVLDQLPARPDAAVSLEITIILQ